MRVDNALIVSDFEVIFYDIQQIQEVTTTPIKMNYYPTRNLLDRADTSKK